MRDSIMFSHFVLNTNWKSHDLELPDNINVSNSGRYLKQAHRKII